MLRLSARRPSPRLIIKCLLTGLCCSWAHSYATKSGFQNTAYAVTSTSPPETWYELRLSQSDVLDETGDTWWQFESCLVQTSQDICTVALRQSGESSRSSALLLPDEALKSWLLLSENELQEIHTQRADYQDYEDLLWQYQATGLGAGAAVIIGGSALTRHEHLKRLRLQTIIADHQQHIASTTAAHQRALELSQGQRLSLDELKWRMNIMAKMNSTSQFGKATQQAQQAWLQLNHQFMAAEQAQQLSEHLDHLNIEQRLLTAADEYHRFLTHSSVVGIIVGIFISATFTADKIAKLDKIKPDQQADHTRFTEQSHTIRQRIAQLLTSESTELASGAIVKVQQQEAMFTLLHDLSLWLPLWLELFVATPAAAASTISYCLPDQLQCQQPEQ